MCCPEEIVYPLLLVPIYIISQVVRFFLDDFFQRLTLSEQRNISFE